MGKMRRTFARREGMGRLQLALFGTLGAQVEVARQLDRRRAFQTPVFETDDATGSLDAFSDFFLTMVPSLIVVCLIVMLLYWCIWWQNDEIRARPTQQEIEAARLRQRSKFQTVPNARPWERGEAWMAP
mgnify:CR=1 FL=1